jgi:hypothetical protein
MGGIAAAGAGFTEGWPQKGAEGAKYIEGSIFLPYRASVARSLKTSVHRAAPRVFDAEATDSLTLPYSEKLRDSSVLSVTKILRTRVMKAGHS